MGPTEDEREEKRQEEYFRNLGSQMDYERGQRSRQAEINSLQSELTAARDEIDQLSMRLKGCQEANKLLHEDKEALQLANRDNMAWFNDAKAEAERLQEACENTVSVLCGNENSGTDTMTIQAKAVMRDVKAEAEKWHSRVATLEMIGSSLLHGHKMSEVDWKAFKALEEYFRIHSPKLEAGGSND